MEEPQGDSPGMRSQVSLDESDQELDLQQTSVSQAQLATQIADPGNSLTYETVANASQYSDYNIKGQEPDPTENPLASTDKFLQDLLDRRKHSGKGSGNTREDGASQYLELSQDAEKPKDVDAPTGTDQTEDDLLTQEELQVPTAVRAPLYDRDNLTKFPSQTKAAPVWSNVVDTYGLDLGVDGRLLWRMTTIPSDQARLLDSDDKWFPSLVGSSVRSPTVPLSLLKSLTVHADSGFARTASTSEADSSIVKYGNPTQKLPNMTIPNFVPDAPGDLISEAGSQDWPDSQSASDTDNRLPPDSPSEQDWAATSRKREPDLKHHHNLPPPSSQQKDISYDGSNRASRQSSDGESPSQTQTSSTSGAQASSNLPLSSTNKKPTESSEPSESKKLVETNKSHPPVRSVEVERTPYPLKIKEPQKSPWTSTNIVPGSFNENQEVLPHMDNGGNTESERPHAGATHHHVDFEHNSSEDEITRSQNDAQPGVSTRTLATTDQRTIDVTRPNNEPRADMTRNADLKHGKRDRAESEVDHEGRQKRKRVAHVADVHQPEQSTSYDDLDAQRRDQRREFYTKLKQDGNQKHTGESYLVPRNHDVIASPIREVAWRDRKSEAAPQEKYRKASASVASASVPLSSKVRQPEAPSGMGTSTKDLFSDFKNAYRDYKGERKDFEASCRLLKATRAKTKIHASLLDAFVYRHYHDYRPYLHIVIEEAGTAMSYADYFDEILNPGCTKLIITPARLELTSYTSTDGPKRTESMNSRPKSTADISASEQYSENSAQEATTKVAASAQDANMDVDESLPESEQSARSVRAWLERATGAGSPILGNHAKLEAWSTPNRKSKAARPDRTVNNQNNQNNHVSYSREHTPEVMQTTNEPNRASNIATATATLETKSKKLPAMELPPQASRTKMSVPPNEIIADTVFGQFARDYGNLPGERSARQSAPMQRFVDIFSWRR